MSEKKYPSDKADRYVHRFAKPGMREQLKALAKQTGRRTINAEINAALLIHLANGGAQASSLSDADVERIALRVAQLLKSQ